MASGGHDVFDYVSLAANLATLIGLGVATWQFRLGRRAASGAAVISMNEAFRQSWGRFAEATPTDEAGRRHAFADIVNLIETGCALRDDHAFVGRSGKLLEGYLISILELVQSNSATREWLSDLIHQPDTFEHTLRFIKRHRVRFSTPKV